MVVKGMGKNSPILIVNLNVECFFSNINFCIESLGMQL